MRVEPNKPLEGDLLLVVSLLTRNQVFAAPWTAAHQASLSFTIFRSLLKLMSIRSPQPLSHPFPPALKLSQHQGFFSNESALPIRWPKYRSFNFSISPSNEYSV